MNLKLFVAVGTLAVGLTWSAGYAEAVDAAQDLRSSGPLEIAQSPGTGGPVGNNIPGGGVGSGKPAGQTDHGISSSNNMDVMGRDNSGHMNTGTRQADAQRGMQSESGKDGLPRSSAGSTTGGSGTNSFGSMSGSGSVGMGGTSGGTSGGGGK